MAQGSTTMRLGVAAVLATLVWWGAEVPEGAAQELVRAEPVLEYGAEWRYVEGPAQPGELWPPEDAAALDPAAWAEGPAPFLGRSQERQDEAEANERRRRRQRRRVTPFEGTLLVYEPADYAPAAWIPEYARDRYESGPSTYRFVTTFEVEDVERVTAAFVEAKFSGGIIAYLNGREWFRDNVHTATPPDGEADIEWMDDHISQTVNNHWQRALTGLDPSLLREGTNTLAVDLRRRADSAPRAVYLDLQVRVFREHGFVKSPYLQWVTHDAVTVMWETATPSIGYVELGSGERLERVATSPRVAATMNEVRLTELLPDTRYFYRVHSLPVDGGEPSVSPIHSFHTAARPGTPFNFLLYGDNRTNSEVHARLIQRMREHADREEARFVLNTGDLITHSAPWDEWQDEFFGPALPLMQDYPMYAALGNHEGNHETWYEYLALPGNESWYSFTYGDVEFFALNTSASMTPESPQRQWLVQALTNSTARWQVAFFHHPPYSCVPVRKPGSLVIQEHIVPVFEELGVDLVLLGHDHLYGRSVEMNGVIYVISGGGGASTYPAEPDEINEICVQVHHYCIVRVSEGSLELEAITIDGELLDSFSVVRAP
jgi:hypothetical protein